VIEPNLFHAEIFALDGELIGIKTRPLTELSDKWLAVCESLLERNDASFRDSLGQRLAHIEIGLTAAAGMALGTFYVHGNLVLSTAFFIGFSPAAEEQLKLAFVQSLRDSALVPHASSPEPFAAVASTVERPLCIFVVWGTSGVSKQDSDLVRELSEHFAGAYIRREYRLRA
jgi:hypothetical protein